MGDGAIASGYAEYSKVSNLFCCFRQDSDCQDPALSWNHSLEHSSSVCLCACRQAERTNTLMYLAFFFVVHHGDHSEPLHFRLCINYPELTFMSCKDQCQMQVLHRLVNNRCILLHRNYQPLDANLWQTRNEWDLRRPRRYIEEN